MYVTVKGSYKINLIAHEITIMDDNAVLDVKIILMVL